MKAVISYLDRVFYQLDCFLNAILGGKEDQTISLRAALMKHNEQKAGRFGGGCLICWWLNWTVERHHCAKQLDGIAAVRWAAVHAAVMLISLGFLIFYAPLIWAFM